MSDTDRRTNLPPLRLHVPEPPFRPGDPVDYSHMEIPAAGALDRPAVDAPAATMREMPYGLIRVLDERSEEHTSELQSLMRISYAVFCLKKKKKNTTENPILRTHTLQ